jgi:hypothetical protein
MRIFPAILCLIFILTGLVVLPGCGKRRSDSPAKSALEWKKAKEGELSGDQAEKGD